MRVVRVREKGPEPEGLRRVCYAYGCVDLTGAGLEPYLLIRGVSSGRRSERVPSQGHLAAGSPLQLYRLLTGKTGLVSHGDLEESILSELGQYYSAVDTFHGSRGLWFDRSTGVNTKELSARGIGPDRSPCALLLLSSGAYDERTGSRPIPFKVNSKCTCSDG